MSTVTFERSYDWELIKRIATHPKVYPWISDDASPKPEAWEPAKLDCACYVVVKDGADVLGMWVLVQHNAVTWEIHTALLPEAYGERARTAARDLAGWVWANIAGCRRVTTEVPAYNRLALRFAKTAGLTEYGTNPQAYMKNGKLYDIILLGISREVKQCQ